MVLRLDNTQREIILHLLFVVLGLEVEKQAMKSSLVVLQKWRRMGGGELGTFQSKQDNFGEMKETKYYQEAGWTKSKPKMQGSRGQSRPLSAGAQRASGHASP